MRTGGKRSRTPTNSQSLLVIIYIFALQRQRGFDARARRKCPILFPSKENRLSCLRRSIVINCAIFLIVLPPLQFQHFNRRCKSRLESKSTSYRPRFVARHGVKFMEAVRAREFMRIQCLNWKIIGQCLAADRSARGSLFSRL